MSTLDKNVMAMSGSMFKPTGDKEVDDFLLYVTKMHRKARQIFDIVNGRFVITPKIASYVLKNLNTNNRPIKESYVKEKADILKRGQHRVTTQGLVFSWEDIPRLLDGQHRLAAIVTTGLPAEYRIAFGENPANFPFYDTGKIRKTDAVVAIQHGHDMHKELAAAGVLAWRIEEGDLDLMYTNQDILAGLEEMPLLHQTVRDGARIARKLKQWGTKTAFAVALERIRRQADDETRVGEFVDRLYDGANEPRRSAVIVLRDRIMSGVLGDEYRGRIKMAYMVAAIVVAWNYWIRDKAMPIRALEQTWRPDQKDNPFPRAD